MLRLTNINDWNFFKLLESAISIDSIVDNNDIIIVRYLKKNLIKLALYNIKSNEILGYITAYKSDNNLWQIDRSASQKGYGPLMYDNIMMEIYPNSIQPSHLITQNALNVWKYYFFKRNDIIKSELNKDSKNYADFYKNDDSMESPKLKNIDNLNIINTLYSKKITPEYVYLINKSNQIINNNNNNININTIFKKALDFFESKYWTLQDNYNIKESLNINDDIFFIKNGTEYCLTTKNKILAYADLHDNGEYFIFDKIYGPGYGYLMHKLVLMDVYPKKVRPSASSKQKVIDIWKKIKNESESIKAIDKWSYYDDYINNKQTKDLDIVNTLYFIKPNNEYIKLIEKSKDFIKKMNLLLNNQYINKRIKIARELFQSNYI